MITRISRAYEKKEKKEKNRKKEDECMDTNSQQCINMYIYIYILEYKINRWY